MLDSAAQINVLPSDIGNNEAMFQGPLFRQFQLCGSNPPSIL